LPPQDLSSGRPHTDSLKEKQPFEAMNSLVAQLLNHLTASMRFNGSLNLDLNEITMNLVPYPRMHFLISALSPLFVEKDMRVRTWTPAM
jgi:tubulin epsilon